MKKRLLTMLAVLVLLVCVLPMAVSAAECTNAEGHKYTLAVGTKMPTCEEDGYMSKACVYCDDVQTTTFYAQGHDMDDGVVTTEPKCEEAGVKTYTCQRDNCGHTETETLEATGHAYIVQKSATATCEEAAYKIEKCDNCGDEKTTTIGNPAGHDMDDGVVTTEPKCEEAGVKTYTCQRDNCGHTETETVAATGHAYIVQKSATATCEEAAYRIEKCDNCGDEKTTTIGDPAGHDMDDGVVTTEPKCEEAGVKTYTCQRDNCGHTETETVAATGHKYIVQKAEMATCEEAAYRIEKCDNCDDEKTTIIGNALGHDWDDGEVTKKPTYISKGVKTYTCVRGCTKTEEIPMLIAASTKGLDDVPKTGSALIEWLYALIFG